MFLSRLDELGGGFVKIVSVSQPPLISFKHNKKKNLVTFWSEFHFKPI